MLEYSKNEGCVEVQNFSSCSERNAVKVVAFAFRMVERFSDEHIKVILKKAKESEELKEIFGEPKEQQMFSTTINPDGTQQHSSGLGGVLFEKSNSDPNKQFGWRVLINVDQILFQCMEYTRWQSVFEELKNYIEQVFNLIESDLPTHQISLEYLDEFILHHPESNWKKELFAEDCSYILPNIYELEDFWHINHGYFITKPELGHKMLDTLNINYFTDEQDAMKQKIQIRTQHNLLLGKSLYEKNKFFNYLDEMHTHSKSMFETIIRKEVRDEFSN
jgi:uncharacterized protein (TIGR04255 family)